MAWFQSLTVFLLVWHPSLSDYVCECNDRFSCGDDGWCFANYCFKSIKRIKSYPFKREKLSCVNYNSSECAYNRLKSHQYVSKCCVGNFCNANMSLALYDPLPEDKDVQTNIKDVQTNFTNTLLITVGSAVLLLLLLTLAAKRIWRHRKCSKKADFLRSPATTLLDNNNTNSLAIAIPCVGGGDDQSVIPLLAEASRSAATSCGSGRLKQLCETAASSGAGLPLLVQRSVARQVTLVDTVGEGRYGQVWRGTWHGENVAVKIFTTRDERSWFREVEIYQTVLLRHNNVLGFIASDNRDNGTWTQLWLITEFHSLGSLYDYLSTHTLTPALLGRLAAGLVAGLSHLHTCIVGTQGKPAIAHRDLKSRNVLVKDDLTCCIADLGLAVRHRDDDTVDLAPNNRAGTARYMAPEVLDATIDVSQFESFKCADMYALGLILWELLSRCNAPAEIQPGSAVNQPGSAVNQPSSAVNQPASAEIQPDSAVNQPGSAVNHPAAAAEAVSASDYKLPYFDLVGSDPTLQQMYACVVLQRQRPPVHPGWRQHQSLSIMVRVMLGCWYQTPSARLTVLRVKKSMKAFESSLTVPTANTQQP